MPMEKIETSSDFEKVIRELNEKLSREYDDFFGITFFGSRSRGDFSSDSDFDIVVLFSKELDWRKENDVLDMIYEKELEYDILIDAKVYHDEELKKQNTPFRVNVMREGTFYGT
jgi:predicted nucleotidyltransferase